MSGPLSNPYMFKSAAGATGFYSHQIANSVRMVAPSSTSSSNARLTQTFGTVDSNVHFTLNFWIKRSAIEGNNPVGAARLLNVFTPRSGTSGSVLQEFGFAATGSYGGGDAFVITNTNTGAYILSTNNVFRDTSAWYNIHIQADLDNGTAGEKLKIFINGTEADYNVDNRSSYTSLAGVVAGAWTIGDYYNYGYPIQSYLAQWAYVDGSTLAPTVFAEEKNGVWIPKDLSSGITWGSAGHLLMFQDSSALGDDTSGEGNDWTSSNLSTHDQMLDTPTNNFCTLNLLAKGSNATLSEGNLRASGNSSDGSYVPSTMAFKTGKWYCEFLCIDRLEGWPYVSICDYQNTQLLTSVGQVFAIRYQADDDLEQNDSGNTKSFGSITLDATGLTTYDDGDIIGTYIDCDNKKLWFTKNGSYFNSGDPSAGTNPQATWTGTPTIAFMGATYQDWDYIMNFGADGTFAGEKTAQGNADGNGYGNFYYAPDTGFLAMCSRNFPIVDEVDPAQTSDNYPQKLFGATIWTGDGNTSRAITGVEFQPDWLWFKSRGSAFSHRIYDTSRGITSTGGKRLFSNTTAVETNQTSGQDISAVGSDGFTLGASSSLYTNDTNDGGLHVAWAWRANGGTTSTNSNGGTDSTVQVDPSGHFSIVLGTGNNDSWGNAQTFGHGLSAAPTVIIGKQRADNADEWQVFFNNYGNTSIGGSNAASNSLVLNSTDDLYTNQSYKGFGGVMPTSTVFTLDGNNLVGNTHTFVCYCFADCEGYIKSGTFIGNGSTDGTFVYTGFKPAFILMKRINRNGDYWYLFDTTRNPFNGPGMKMLNADDTIVESSHGTSNVIDILSNGWKMRTSGSGLNGSGGEWVFLAMADNSLKYATAR